MHAAPRLALDPDLFSVSIRNQPGFAIDFATDLLDDEQFAECVRKAPLRALESADIRLCKFPELRRYCIEMEPTCALGYYGTVFAMDDRSRYSCSLRRERWWSTSKVVLNDEEFNYCMIHAPGPALELESSNERMNDDQFAYCLEMAPSDALRCWWNRLNIAQKAYCVDQEPRVALWCIGAVLPTEMLVKAANQEPSTVIMILNYKRGDIAFRYFRDDLLHALMPLYNHLDHRVIAEVAKMTVQGI